MTRTSSAILPLLFIACTLFLLSSFLPTITCSPSPSVSSPPHPTSCHTDTAECFDPDMRHDEWYEGIGARTVGKKDTSKESEKEKGNTHPAGSDKPQPKPQPSNSPSTTPASKDAMYKLSSKKGHIVQKIGIKPLVTLVMIVKNEANGIRSTLDSVLGYVDRYCIVDTGSTDKTIEIITKFFETNLEPWQYALHHEQFIDFSTTRNRALLLAGPDSEFVFMLNGDDRLVGGREFRRFLETNRHLRGIQEEMYIVPVNYGGISIGRSERIARSANHFVPNWPNDELNHWRFEGVTHEVYVNQHALQNGVEMLYTNEGFEVYHDISHDTKESKRARFELDVELLSNEIKMTGETHPNYARSLYYLAQSYYNLNRWDDAYYYYTLRVNTNYPHPTDPTADNEKSRSYLLMSLMASKIGKSRAEAIELLEHSYSYCPTSYSLLLIAMQYRQLGRFEEAKRTALQALERLHVGTSIVCGDDDNIVRRQLPIVMSDLGLEWKEKEEYMKERRRKGIKDEL